MGDLISRSKLLKEIETWGGCVEALHEYISNMPTAYNVDAVVAELEEASTMDDIDDAFYIREYVAIEIVRRGGVQ
jgi:hypothetical protein